MRAFLAPLWPDLDGGSLWPGVSFESLFGPSVPEFRGIPFSQTCSFQLGFMFFCAESCRLGGPMPMLFRTPSEITCLFCAVSCRFSGPMSMLFLALSYRDETMFVSLSPCLSLSLSLCLPRSSCLTVCLSRSLPSCLHACQPKPTSQASNQPASKPNHLASQPQTIKPPTMNKTSVNGTPIGFYSREGVYR